MKAKYTCAIFIIIWLVYMFRSCIRDRGDSSGLIVAVELIQAEVNYFFGFRNLIERMVGHLDLVGSWLAAVRIAVDQFLQRLTENFDAIVVKRIHSSSLPAR